MMTGWGSWTTSSLPGMTAETTSLTMARLCRLSEPPSSTSPSAGRMRIPKLAKEAKTALDSAERN